MRLPEVKRDAVGEHERLGGGDLGVFDERFRATFEQTAVGLVHIDFDGRLLHVNRRFCQLLGYDKAELLTMRPGAITHPEDRGGQAAGKAQLLRGEAESASREKRYLHKSGRVVWVRATLSLARDEQGSPCHFVAVIEDISGHKQFEEYHRATVEFAPVGIWHTGIDKRTLHVNRKLCDMLGYSKEELLALRSQDIVVRAHYGADQEQFERLNAGEIASFCSERPLRCKDGRVIWVDRTVSVVRDAAGKPIYHVRVMADITDRKRAEDALKRDRALLRAVVDNLPERIYVKDAEGRYLLMNAAAMQLRGIQDHAQIVGKCAYDILPAGIAAGIESEDQAVIASGKPILNREQRTTTRNDRGALAATRWHATSKVPLLDDSGKVFGLVGVNRDITEQKRATNALVESERKFRQLAENIPEIFWITDVAQRETLYISAAFRKITGRSISSTRTASAWLRIVHAEDRRRVYEARKALPHGEYDIEYRIVRPGGEVRWIHDQAFPVYDGEQRAYRIAGIAADITPRKQAEAKLVHLAHYDALTGLPNRVLFNDRLKQHMAQARRRGEAAVVVMLGLDRFKVANDTLGPAVGDELLKQVAQRLTSSLRKGDTVARLSGDEFALVLAPVTPDAAADDARALARKVLDMLAAPFSMEGHELFLSASAGVSLFPADGEDERALIKNAGTAMCRAKEAGGNRLDFYTAEMNTRTLQRLEMENGLRRAIEREELLLHYQPKVDLGSGEITGFEALLRWQRPGHGLVSPAQFVPLLEETGLIVPAGEWIIHAACAQIGTWRRAGIEPRPIAINLSARQFNDKNLAATIKHALEEHLVESFLLELEITESSLMHNTEDAIATLKYLKSLGLKISIDDFGTGYSSLGYLKRFPLDALKVDRSFVRDITSDADDAAICAAIISMAHSLGLKVIAEGVETEAQLDFLTQHGCEQMQGYYFSKPVPVAQCSAMLHGEWRLHRLPAN